MNFLSDFVFFSFKQRFTSHFSTSLYLHWIHYFHFHHSMFCFVCHPPLVFSSHPLQGAVPLIWSSVHLIHLSWLWSEGQEDSHGSVQVTDSSFLCSLSLTICVASPLPVLPLVRSWSGTKRMHDLPSPQPVSLFTWMNHWGWDCGWPKTEIENMYFGWRSAEAVQSMFLSAASHLLEAVFFFLLYYLDLCFPFLLYCFYF